MRKLLWIFIVLVVTSLAAVGQDRSFFDGIGEMYSTEGLLIDIEQLLNGTKKTISYKSTWPCTPAIRSYFERLDSLS